MWLHKQNPPAWAEILTAHMLKDVATPTEQHLRGLKFLYQIRFHYPLYAERLKSRLHKQRPPARSVRIRGVINPDLVLQAAKAAFVCRRTLEGVGATPAWVETLQAAKAAFVCLAAPLRVSEEFGENIMKETRFLAFLNLSLKKLFLLINLQ